MFGSLTSLFVVFAQAAAGGGAKGGEPSPLLQFAPLIAVPFIFYFMMLRPQQIQDKKRRELINNLKKNDKVLTAAGMYGTVIAVDEKTDRVQLRLDDDGKVKATFTKASIVRVLGEPVEKVADAK